MWEVFEHSRVEKAMERLPAEIVKRYEKWKDIVSVSGPPGLRLIKGFHDEALQGPLRGLRSSRLNIQFRVIYQVVAERQEIRVHRISSHDYREA